MTTLNIISNTTITPSTLLNTLCRDGKIEINDKVVTMTKNEYVVTNCSGDELFRQNQNASTFWLLTDFIGITDIKEIEILKN